MPDEMRIGLLRHGETVAGQVYLGSKDIELNEHGWQQMAAALADNRCWQRVISSPLKRCADFAQVYAQHEQIDMTLNNNLREMHFGVWEGRAAADIMHDGPALENFWRDPETHAPPGGENLHAFRRRVLSGFIDCCRSAKGDILFITHGGVIRILLYHLQPGKYDSLFAVSVPHGALEIMTLTPEHLVAIRQAAA